MHIHFDIKKTVSIINLKSQKPQLLGYDIYLITKIKIHLFKTIKKWPQTRSNEYTHIHTYVPQSTSSKAHQTIVHSLKHVHTGTQYNRSHQCILSPHNQHLLTHPPHTHHTPTRQSTHASWYTCLYNGNWNVQYCQYNN